VLDPTRVPAPERAVDRARWLEAFDRYERLGFLPKGVTAQLT
jgi:hypothetical protein